MLAACSKAPTLSALEPADGQPHDVVFVDGSDRELAQIVWDADAPGEKVIPGAFLGAFMFSVPPGATPGPHTIKLQNKGGRSNPLTFNVPSSPSPLDIPRPPGPSVPFPEPRIDAVTVIGASFDTAGVHSTLYVQGADIDVGATVWVKESPSAPLAEIATASHRVLRNDWFGVSADQLDYPIYHYSSMIASPGVRPAGQELFIVVKNLDGGESKEFKYKLPSDADSLDSDGDGLLDKWEKSGYDADGDGMTDVDLAASGADPYRRDLFLELDIMDDVEYRPDRAEEDKPDSTVFDALKNMFEAAPIINLGEARGIHLVIDASGKPCVPDPPGPDKCSFEYTIFNTSTTSSSGPPPPGQARFLDLKANSFRNDIRGKIYHYAIWGIQRAPDFDAGVSDTADDFLITIDKRGPTFQNRRSQVEVLAHEFGHDLGQLHGGDDHLPARKPNYLSVMSYAWELRSGWETDAERQQDTTCLPFYYGEKGATETFGAPPTNVNLIVDYSEGMAKALVKPPPLTAAATTFCGLTVDWTRLSPATKVADFPNWRSLVFDGPATNGRLTP